MILVISTAERRPACLLLADFNHHKLRPNTVDWLCGLSRSIIERCTHEAERAVHAGEGLLM